MIHDVAKWTVTVLGHGCFDPVLSSNRNSDRHVTAADSGRLRPPHQPVRLPLRVPGKLPHDRDPSRAIRRRCIIPTANPKTAPNKVASGLVPHQQSNPAPINGGRGELQADGGDPKAHCIPMESLERGSDWFTIASAPRVTGDGGRDRGNFNVRETSRHLANQAISGSFIPGGLGLSATHIPSSRNFYNVLESVAILGFGERAGAWADRSVGDCGMLQIWEFVHGRTLEPDFLFDTERGICYDL